MSDSPQQTKQSQSQPDVGFPSSNGEDNSIGTIFHQSRVITDAKDITLRPVEIVATYDFYDSKESNFPMEFVSNSRYVGNISINEGENIPILSAFAKEYKFINDCDERPVSTEYYLRCESSELVDDIYIPFGINDGDVNTANKQLEKLEPLIGEHDAEQTQFISLPQEMKNTELQNVTIDRGSVSIPQKPDESMFDDMGYIKTKLTQISMRDDGLSNYINTLFSQGASAVVSVSTIITICIVIALTFFYPAPLWSIVGGSALLSIIYLGYMILTTTYQSIQTQLENNNETDTITYDYQTHRPDDAHVVTTTDSVDKESVSFVTVQATVDKADNVCRFHSQDNDKTWDVEMDNGLMSDELISFFETVGSEKVEETFVVKKQNQETAHSIETQTDNVYLVPANM